MIIIIIIFIIIINLNGLVMPKEAVSPERLLAAFEIPGVFGTERAYSPHHNDSTLRQASSTSPRFTNCRGRNQNTLSINHNCDHLLLFPGVTSRRLCCQASVDLSSYFTYLFPVLFFCVKKTSKFSYRFLINRLVAIF